MDAIKFMQEYQRMCSSCELCADCPLYTDRPCSEIPSKYTDEFFSKLIKVVDDWSAAHPVNTRADIFKKTYPDAPTDTLGALLICPKKLDKKLVCDYEVGCAACRKNYWMKEVQS